jgi:putative holliday junction resolvase
MILEKSRLMAIDYGRKRVGIASTDSSGEFALPRAVWPNDSLLLEKILKFRQDAQIDKIIIGESLDLDQKENPIHEDAQRLKAELEKRGVEVIFHPEFFTSIEAERLQGKVSELDSSAAALILKSYIDSA